MGSRSVYYWHFVSGVVVEGHWTSSQTFICSFALITPLTSGSGECAWVHRLGKTRAKGLSQRVHRGVAIILSVGISVGLLWDPHTPASNSPFCLSLITLLFHQNELWLVLWSLSGAGKNCYIFSKEKISTAWTYKCLSLKWLRNDIQTDMIKYQKLATSWTKSCKEQETQISTLAVGNQQFIIQQVFNLALDNTTIHFSQTFVWSNLTYLILSRKNFRILVVLP